MPGQNRNLLALEPLRLSHQSQAHRTIAFSAGRGQQFASGVNATSFTPPVWPVSWVATWYGRPSLSIRAERASSLAAAGALRIASKLRRSEASGWLSCSSEDCAVTDLSVKI